MRDYHGGIDIQGNIGDPIYSISNGVVVYTGWNSYYGRMLITVKLDASDAKMIVEEVRDTIIANRKGLANDYGLSQGAINHTPPAFTIEFK